MMFKKRQRNSIIASPKSSPKPKPIIIEDLSKNLIPINGKSSYCILIHNLLTPIECTNLIRRAEDTGFDDALVQGPNGRQILRQDIRSCGRCIMDDVALADAVYVRILNALKQGDDNNKNKNGELEKKLLHAPWINNNYLRRRNKASGSLDDGSSVDSTASSTRSSNAQVSAASAAQDEEEEATITAVGLNERLRFIKYTPGNFFGPHRDLRYTRGPDAGPQHAGETSHVTVQLYLNDKFKGGTTRFLCGNRHYDVKPRLGSALIFDHDLLHEGSKVVGGTKYSVRTDVMYTPLVVRSERNQKGGGGEGFGLASLDLSETARA